MHVCQCVMTEFVINWSALVLQLWPLPAIYLGNVIFGLGGTKKLRYLHFFTVIFTYCFVNSIPIMLLRLFCKL